VAAGDDARLGIELAKKRDRFREIGRPMILERSGDQDTLPSNGANVLLVRCSRARFAQVEQARFG
jgi:hypothetical protein